MERFVEHMEDVVMWLYATFPEQTMTDLMDMLKGEFKTAKICNVCFKEFSSENRKVRYHCHYTGLYRIPDNIPVVFHKLKGYNAHLFNN